jgi:hypothetical protein
MAPDGTVYFAAESNVLRIQSDGDLTVIEDGSTFDSSDPAVMFEQQCYPVSLAFDSAGDLYIGCSSPWVLLMRTPDGSLHDLGTVRPHDARAALTPSPSGGVLVVDGEGVFAYGSAKGPVDFHSYRLPDGSFFWPQGVAATSDGTLYVDQDGVSGIGPPAIVECSMTAGDKVLWSEPLNPRTGA